MPDNANAAAGFWTDANQAAERLDGTFVMLGDKVVYIRQIEGLDAFYTDPLAKTDLKRAPLNSPLWHNFRKLPPLGWRNVALEGGRKSYVGAVYLRRRALRSRSHGYRADNVTPYSFFEEPGRVNIERNLTLAYVYGDALNDDPNHYPEFKEAFDLLRPKGSAALSAKFALAKDADNLTWLFRKRERVALVPDNNTLLILRSMRFYADDIRANHILDTVDIQEL
jgi:hypothetical protein